MVTKFVVGNTHLLWTEAISLSLIMIECLLPSLDPSIVDFQLLSWVELEGLSVNKLVSLSRMKLKIIHGENDKYSNTS